MIQSIPASNLNDTYTCNITEDCSNNSDCKYFLEDNLWKMPCNNDDCNCDDKLNRPSFLDLAGTVGNTPIISRKPKFQFSGKLKVKQILYP